MKKIFLALLLVASLCLTLIGCGEQKDGADYMFEALKESETAMQSVFGDPTAELVPTRVTLSAKDVSSLCTLLGADLGGIEIRDASVGLTASEASAQLDLAAALGGAPLSLSAITDGKTLALASEHLSATYGGTVEELLTLAETLTGSDLEALMTQMQNSISADLEKTTVELDARYEAMLEELVREHMSLTVENVDKNVVVSGEFTPENVAAITCALVTEIKQDADMLDLMRQMGGEAAVEELQNMTVDAAEMAADLTDAGFSGTIKLTAVKKTSAFVALELNLVADDEPVSIDVTRTDDGCTARVEDNNSTVTMECSIGEDTANLLLVGSTEDVETIRLAVDVAEDVDVSVTLEGETVGVKLAKAQTENKTELTLVEVSVGGFALDLTPYGICLAVETGVEAPTMPTEYTSVAGYTAEQLQGILMEFIMNSGLLSVLG